MESNRYFILDLRTSEKPVVLVDSLTLPGSVVLPYLDEAQASFDYVRLGGLTCPDIILARECEVNLRTDGKTLAYTKGEEKNE